MCQCVCVYWCILSVSIHSKIDQPGWRVFLVTTTPNSVEDTYIGRNLRLIIPCICRINAFFTHAHTHTQCVYISEIIVTKTVSRRRRPVYNIFASFRLSGAVASPNGIQTVFDTIIIIFSRARWDIHTMRSDEMHRHRRSRRSTTSNDAFFEYFYSFAFISFSVFPQTHGRRVELPVYSSVVVAVFYYYILCIVFIWPPFSQSPIKRTFIIGHHV